MFNGAKNKYCFKATEIVHGHIWPNLTLHYLERPIDVLNGLVIITKYSFDSTCIDN